jgi:hypothetical protein
MKFLFRIFSARYRKMFLFFYSFQGCFSACKCLLQLAFRQSRHRLTLWRFFPKVYFPVSFQQYFMFNFICHVSTPKNEKNICMESFQERHNSSGKIAVVILFLHFTVPICLLKTFLSVVKQPTRRNHYLSSFENDCNILPVPMQCAWKLWTNNWISMNLWSLAMTLLVFPWADKSRCLIRQSTDA